MTKLSFVVYCLFPIASCAWCISSVLWFQLAQFVAGGSLAWKAMPCLLKLNLSDKEKSFDEAKIIGIRYNTET